jgi:hypothetical protein
MSKLTSLNVSEIIRDAAIVAANPEKIDINRPIGGEQIGVSMACENAAQQFIGKLRKAQIPDDHKRMGVIWQKQVESKQKDKNI